MTFIWPPLLLTLLLVPGGSAGRAADRGSAAGEGCRSHGAPGRAAAGETTGSTGRPRGAGRRLLDALPAALVTAAMLVLCVALARPQATVALPRLEGTVMLLFDVSGSMAADDVTPSRMEVAKAAAKSIVDARPEGVVIGVVAFSDAGLAVQEPTSDQAMVDAAIARMAPSRGTSLGAGILATLAAIDKARATTPRSYYSNQIPGAHRDAGPGPARQRRRDDDRRPVRRREQRAPGPAGGRHGRREPRDPPRDAGRRDGAAARPSTSTGSASRRGWTRRRSRRSPTGPRAPTCRSTSGHDRRLRPALPRARRPRRGRGADGPGRRPSASRSCSPGPPYRSHAEADCRDVPVGQPPRRAPRGADAPRPVLVHPPAAAAGRRALFQPVADPGRRAAVPAMAPSRPDRPPRDGGRGARGGRRATGRGAQRAEQPDHDGPRAGRLGEHVLDGHRADPPRGGDGRRGQLRRVRSRRGRRSGSWRSAASRPSWRRRRRTASGSRTPSAASRRGGGRRSAAASRRPSTRSPRWTRGSRRS